MQIISQLEQKAIKKKGKYAKDCQNNEKESKRRKKESILIDCRFEFAKEKLKGDLFFKAGAGFVTILGIWKNWPFSMIICLFIQ